LPFPSLRQGIDAKTREPVHLFDFSSPSSSSSSSPGGGLEVQAECKLELCDQMHRGVVCRLWFHPYFLGPEKGQGQEGSGAAAIDGNTLVLRKEEIDDAWESSRFPPAFRVEL